MNEFKALVTVRFMSKGDEADSRLNNSGVETEFNIWHAKRTEDEMIALLKDKDATVASSDPFTARVMENCPKLRVIARVGVGYDAVDLEAATRLGIAVCTTPGLNHRSVADYAMALLLQGARKVSDNLELGRAGKWTWAQGRDMAGRTLGIVGLGAIGKEVAKRARGFDMKLLAYDIAPDKDFAASHGVTFVPLETLLRDSDFVTLHTNLDKTSQHLMNEKTLGLMKRDAWLVNTARGGVVDGKALYKVLKEKRIGGAAFDVFEIEPLPAEDPLRTLDNLYISPHAAGASDDARINAKIMAADNVINILNGKAPVSILNPEALKKPRR